MAQNLETANRLVEEIRTNIGRINASKSQPDYLTDTFISNYIRFLVLVKRNLILKKGQVPNHIIDALMSARDVTLNDAIEHEGRLTDLAPRIRGANLQRQNLPEAVRRRVMDFATDNPDEDLLDLDRPMPPPPTYTGGNPPPPDIPRPPTGSNLYPDIPRQPTRGNLYPEIPRPSTRDLPDFIDMTVDDEPIDANLLSRGIDDVIEVEDPSESDDVDMSDAPNYEDYFGNNSILQNLINLIRPESPERRLEAMQLLERAYTARVTMNGQVLRSIPDVKIFSGRYRGANQNQVKYNYESMWQLAQIKPNPNRSVTATAFVDAQTDRPLAKFEVQERLRPINTLEGLRAAYEAEFAPRQ